MMSKFEWDDAKNISNQTKHGVSFEIIIHDEKHSQEEERWFCIGKVDNQVLTVRFTYRDGTIRIFGAGEWRKWRRYYDQENG